MEDIKFNEIYIKEEFESDNASDIQSLQTELNIKEELLSENYQDDVNSVQNDDGVFLESKYEIGQNIDNHHTSSEVIEHMPTCQPNYNQLPPSSSNGVSSPIHQILLLLPEHEKQQQAPSVNAHYKIRYPQNSCTPDLANTELAMENAVALENQLLFKALQGKPGGRRGRRPNPVPIPQPVLNIVVNEPNSENAELDIENAIPSYELTVGDTLNGPQNAVSKLEIANVIKHIKNVPLPKPNPIYICDEPGCMKTCEDENSFSIHRLIHSHEKPHKCKNCDQVFKMRSNYLRHQKLQSCDMARKTCDICNKVYATRSILNSHKKRVHSAAAVTKGKTHFCEICNRGFAEKSQLDRHRYTHQDKLRYQCDQCDRSFNQKHYLVDHQIAHTGERVYVCEICDKSFSSRENLRRHKGLHSDVCAYVCKICNEGFKTSALRYKHMFVHRDKNLNVCEMCNMPFRTKRGLIKHCKLMHNEK